MFLVTTISLLLNNNQSIHNIYVVIKIEPNVIYYVILLGVLNQYKNVINCFHHLFLVYNKTIKTSI